MKFSDNLAAQLTPEWRSKYIDYEMLKKIIYSIQSKMNATDLEGGEYEQELNLVIENMCKNFIVEIHKQLDGVIEFYKSQELQIMVKFSELKKDLDQLMVANEKGIGFLYRSRRLDDLRFAFREFYLNLVILQNYRELNSTGFRKILKKFDKVSK